MSLAHPWSKEVIRNSARQDGYAAKKREQMTNTTAKSFQEAEHPTVYLQFSSTLAPGGPPLINSSTPYHQDLETKKDETILLSSGHIGDVDFQYSYNLCHTMDPGNREVTMQSHISFSLIIVTS